MPATVPDSARDPATPDDVKIMMTPRVPDFDPTLGVKVKSAGQGRPKHRLVTIGDSLTHGFQSGAIFNTRVSWPMIVAWELGWDDHFRFPTYDGFGGLPLNIEFILRDLEKRFGDSINWWELGLAAFELRHRMAQIEDWWERGPGSRVPSIQGIMHNLSVYGWDLRDALSQSASTLAAAITKPRNQLLSQIVEHANERAAMSVYQSARDAAGAPLDVFKAAARLGQDGASLPDGKPLPNEPGIETLIVFLGANNALATVLGLKVVWSGDGYDDLDKKTAYTIWRPTHFESELTHVIDAVKAIRARHVIFGNVPHLTIAPVARGVARKVRPDSRYFPFYTRPWIKDDQFDQQDDPCLTEQQARAIDSAIDQYNDAIAKAVRQGRKNGLDWYLLDVAGVLDRLAARRYHDSPRARPDWWTPYPLPDALQALKPVPDSRFFVSGSGGRIQGGLFSLDGVHPTTIAYGLLAQEFIQIMQLAGVDFYYGDGITKRQSPIHVDFKRLIALDTLISDPPRSIDSDLRLIGWLDQSLGLLRNLVTR